MRTARRSPIPTANSGVPSLPPGFTDEVMRAIGRAPRPSPARSFRSAIRARSTAEAGAALSVAARIVRRNRSMPLMVRAQALALVALVAGSIVGGGALAGVVAYQAVAPIIRAVSEPVGDRAPTRHDAMASAPAPASPGATPDVPAAIAPRAHNADGGPDRPPTRTAADDKEVLDGEDERPGEDVDEQDPADTPDGDSAVEADDAAEPDQADPQASGSGDESSEGAEGSSDAGDEPSGDADGG